MSSLWRAHALVTAAVLATFARALPYPLQARWDDGRFILDNALVREPSWRAFFEIVSKPQLEAYHPLHLLSYWLDVPWLHGATPQTFALVTHGVQLAIFALAANVLLRLMLALGLALPFATLATLACALHPIQVEVVSWASGRKDALALLFVAAAWLAHLRSSAWASRALYLCAALSKTTALPLPLALVISDVLLARKPLRAAIAQQAPALAIGAALGAGVLTIWSDSAMVRTTEGSIAAAPLRLVSTLGHQLSSALFPHALSPLYATSGLTTPGAGAWLVSLAFVAVCIALARNGSGPRRELCGLLVFGVMLTPVSNLVPMYFPFQDRYLSLPLVGLSFGVFAGVERLIMRSTRARTMGLTVACACVAALAWRSIQYQGEWQSELRLWGHAAHAQPTAYYAWMKLGELRRENGQLAGAEQAYERALALEPSRKLSHAALLQARALRDETKLPSTPSRAERYAAAYFAALDDAPTLRQLAGQMLATGHLRALELPLARALELAPLPDAALERAARVQLEHGRLNLARVYLLHMRNPPHDPQLKAIATGR